MKAGAGSLGARYRLARPALALALGCATGAGCGRLGYEQVAWSADGSDGGAHDASPDRASASADGGSGSTGDAIPPDLPPGVLVERDFEDDQALWQRSWSERGGMLARVTDTVRSGRAAMRIQTRGLHGMAALDLDLPAPLTDGELYLRGHFFLPAGQRHDDWILLMEAVASTTNRKVSFDVYPGPVTALHVSDTTPVRGAPPTYDRWFCATLQLRLHAMQGTATLRVDANAPLELTGLDTLLGSGIDIVRVGLLTGPRQGDTTLYVDDFTASRLPLPCP